MRKVIPLKKRPIDLVLLVFFYINIIVITYIIDLEQLVIADPKNFEYPIWPPAFMVDVIHWWGNNFDPLLMARPVWWKATIWIDSIYFGPFYVAAIYAFTMGKEWIRVPSLVYAGLMIANVTIIMNEELWGTYPTPQVFWMCVANAPWFSFPFIIIMRFRNSKYPFTEEVS
jgi:hypothetical protein